jgi:signal transduction histidine kinase
VANPTGLAHRLELLVTINAGLTTELELGRVLHRIAAAAAELLGARFAALGLLGPDGRSLETFTTAGLSPQEIEAIGPLPTGKGLLGEIIRHARPLRLRDLAAHPASTGVPPGHPAMRSFLGVPVIGRHGAIGNLYFAEKDDGPEFTEEDEYLAVLLAANAASAVENARAHAESARSIAEAQSLLRARERFFAMVNHELRNSLAAVFGWAEMLVRRKDPATVPKAAFEVLEAADSAIALINDLLDLSRLDEDRLKPVHQDVDIGPVIRRAVAKTTPAAQGRGTQVLVEMGDAPAVLRTDAHRVEQILVNLLTNALRHSPTGSTVRVSPRLTPTDVEVTVADEGEGIPEATLPHIFDIYYTKPGDEGTGVGLGLPLSRRLARVLGGDLVGGNRPEGGAAFTLLLPRRRP